MGYMLDFLRSGGIGGAVLSLGYLPDPIQEYLAKCDLDGFSVDYAVEDRALGTAGGIKNAEKYLDGGPVVVVNGDVLCAADLRKAIEQHQASDALATITLTSVEDPTAYGLVEVDHNMLVHRFIEKPAYDEVSTNLINAGVYVLEPEVLEMIPAGREVSIEREIFPEVQARGRLRAYVSSSYWKDIGTPRSYLAASHDVLSGAVGADEDFDYLDVCSFYPPRRKREASAACIGRRRSVRSSTGRPSGEGRRSAPGAASAATPWWRAACSSTALRVEAGAVVRGSIIGPAARVGQNAIVRGLSVLGARSVVGEGNVLDQGLRLNPGVVLSPRSLSF